VIHHPVLHSPVLFILSNGCVYNILAKLYNITEKVQWD